MIKATLFVVAVCAIVESSASLDQQRKSVEDGFDKSLNTDVLEFKEWIEYIKKIKTTPKTSNYGLMTTIGQRSTQGKLRSN